MGILIGLYFIASLAHFAHNAELIAFYPGMPAWLTAEKVWLAWLGITGVGIAALAMALFGLTTLAVALLGVYGALGLDGLAHYTLALCSEHTVLANVTIWSEAACGVTLLIVSALTLVRRLRAAVAGGQG